MTEFLCYHTTTVDRIEKILVEGLRPNSPPTWFASPAPYVLLSEVPLWTLNGEESVVLVICDPTIKLDYFEDSEGLRWPYVIEEHYLDKLSR